MPEKNGKILTNLKREVRIESLPTFGNMSPKIIPTRAVS